MLAGSARRRWVAATLGGILLAACGRAAPGTGSGQAPPSPPGSSSPSTTVEPEVGPDLESPPPVTVRFGEGSVDLQPWTYCYANACVDGFPPEEPPDVGDPIEVIVEFPLPDWTFTASFRPAGDACGRAQEAPVQPVGEGRFVLRPVGHAAIYDVTLFGVGGGDLFVTFRWSTPVDGPMPEPEARLAVLADHDGRVDSYGVELALSNLAATPEEATATITVRAATGAAVTFEATRAGGRCWPEGSVYWDGPDGKGLAAAALGEGPFTYEVDVSLDGVRYSATAVWPDDQIEGNEPSVPLVFTPELPALT